MYVLVLVHIYNTCVAKKEVTDIFLGAAKKKKNLLSNHFWGRHKVEAEPRHLLPTKNKTPDT